MFRDMAAANDKTSVPCQGPCCHDDIHYQVMLTINKILRVGIDIAQIVLQICVCSCKSLGLPHSPHLVREPVSPSLS